MKVLGLDLSTQSCTGLLLDLSTSSLCSRIEVPYDCLPNTYHTQGGCISAGNQVWSDPRLWLDALDSLFQRLCEAGVSGEIEAIAGSAQQHGTVYLRSTLSTSPEEGQSLASWLSPLLATYQSPIWKDSSTAAECEEITTLIGGAEAVQRITGSKLYERFPAPQIRKIWKGNKDLYQDAAYILPISAFMTAVLSDSTGFSLDYTEGAGTGLMDIRLKAWDEGLLAATAPDLKQKLPTLHPAGTITGLIRPYFQQRYGLKPSCKAVIWSGDNPCSALGLGLTAPGTIGVSLGSSDTLFFPVPSVPESNVSTVFLTLTGDYLPIIVVKNGASARLQVRNSLSLTWESFDQLASTPTPSLFLFFSNAEITPPLSHPLVSALSSSDPTLCRALIDSQVINLKIATEEMQGNVREIRATGGAAECRALLQALADVFQVQVSRSEGTDHAALGAAISAAYGVLGDWEEAGKRVNRPIVERIQPDSGLISYYCEKETRFKLLLQSNS